MQPRLHSYPGHRLTTHQQSARRRASFRLKVYGPMARLPVGIIPQICVAVATTRDMMIRRMKRRASKATAVCVFLGVLTPIAFADQLAQTYLKPGVEAISAAQLSPANSSVTPYYGTEIFNELPTGSTGFTTNFNTGGTTSSNLAGTNNITGTFSGSFTIAQAGQYGGAGGTGNYITTSSVTGSDLKLTHTSALPGINYIGLQISALDAGNTLTFYRAGVQVGQYTPANLIQQVGACPSASNGYCGNPTTGENASQQYAYVNFFDLSGYFDEIKFTETCCGGFESDNYTVGYVDTNAVFQATNVPEPSSTGTLLAGLAALVGLTAWQRRPRQTALPIR